jgi:DNA helicase-2/ATP-dependent DNA helicase PcrA
MDFLAGLNPPQREAVTHVQGPLLILAGAGSGKTRVITHRVAHIIRAHHVPSSAVLAVTFTNKAADEMRSRVGALLGDAPPARLNVSTFHSFCVRMLRRDGDALAGVRPGFQRNFAIYDEDDQLSLIKAAYRRLGLDEKYMPYRSALSRISQAKNQHQLPEEMMREAGDPKIRKLAEIFDQYERELRKANALDFDDLLLEAVRLLRHDDATRQAYNRRLSYIMIDEYQDTNRSQYELMRLLSEEHRNVCVVGDEDQSIYSWRGADIRNILDFEKDFPDACVIRLEQNYRSTQRILEAAGAVVAHNTERKGKRLWTEAEAGETLTLYSAFDAENEALYIADTTERLLAQDPSLRVAVLYRTNAQSRQIEEALRRYGRKYLVVGGFSFYQRAEIKDIMAYLKLAVSKQDWVSLVRIINTPARGIGRTTVEHAERYAREQDLPLWDAIVRMTDAQLFPTRAQAAMSAFRKIIEEISDAVAGRPLDEAVRFVIDRTGYRQTLEDEKTPEAEGRLENLRELANAAREALERGDTVRDFLDHAALVAEADAMDEHAPVVLLTLHNAKGLEFPVVFMAGLEEGLFPHSRSFGSNAMMEEERRLCYVGMTRACKRLLLTWARYRRRFGSAEQERSMQSRFLKEVPAHLVEAADAEDSRARVDLTSERWEVRQSVKRNTYTGKTYNSLENIQQFFSERGMTFPKPPAASGSMAKPAPVKPLPKAPPPPNRKLSPGSTVEHPKYGTGLVLRREGEGEDAKITVSFPKYGLKKLVEKYAGLKKS